MTRQETSATSPAPSAPGHLLLVDAELTEHGHDLADDERDGHEHRRQHEPRPGVDDPDARRLERAAEEPVGPVDQHQHQPGAMIGGDGKR